MKKQLGQSVPIPVFYSYAPEDEKLRNSLDKHLSLLQRNGTITTWYNRQIIPGTNWTQVIDSRLNEASLILLLISPDFLASDYCSTVEMQRALERHKNGEACVIPIILRPTDWGEAPFAHLQCLPLDGKPVTTWKNRDTAFLHVAKGIRNAIKDFSSSAYTNTSSDRYRSRLLKTVRSIWITGVLEQSLHHMDLLALNMHEQPDAIDNPWQEMVQETKRSSNPLPPETQITQVHDDADGDLLILGEAGSGKTTQLLEITRQLLYRAENDYRQPVPVLFHIASYYDHKGKKSELPFADWLIKGKKPDDKELPFADWLIDELSRKYKIPRIVGEAWIKNNQILPLLDGFDEVEEKYQTKCIEMINAWKQEHILLPLVVCSRFTEYMAKGNRLYLQKAITLQPLTIQQIDTYLIGKDELFQPLLFMLHNDLALQAVASTPLMLNILLLVCKENADLFKKISPQDVSAAISKKQIFNVYTQQMLSRRKSNKVYDSEKVIYWLSRLARKNLMSSTLVDETILSAPRPKDFPLGWHRRLCRGCDICISVTKIILLLNIGLAMIVSLILDFLGILFHWLIFPAFAVLLIKSILETLLVKSTFSFITSGGDSGKKDGAQRLFSSTLPFYIGILLFSFLLGQRGFIVFLLLLVPVSIILYLTLFIILFKLRDLIARLLLCWSGWMSWNYRQFLDYAVERILLRKEGNSYSFVHALLRDYFASLDDNPPT